jgi:ABC-2 type transport system ATP-binding protein
MPLLEVKNLRKAYGSLVAVDGVSFEIQLGEVFGLLGPNGAGKSTTMLMISGLIPSDGGTIFLDGKEFDPRNPAMRSQLGVVPQDLAIYPELTATENLRFFGQLYGIKGSLLAERVQTALERVGLVNRADDWAGTFSGGMKRRLNFAIALLHHPALLILDEPTVGVDPQSRSHLLDCVRDLNREGVAVIYASHYMEEVQALCQRVAIMDHGKILAMDTLNALLGRMSADLRLRIRKPDADVSSQLSHIAKVVETKEGDGEVDILISQDQRGDAQSFEILSKVTNLLSESGVRLLEIKTHEPNLERLFIELTGSRLRD